MESIKGIIISCNKYKDRDAIVNILTEHQIVPVIVRSAYSKNSKYLQYTHILLEGTFELYEGGTKYFKLRGGTDLIDYSALIFDYDSMVCIELIKELMVKTMSEDNFRNYYLLIRKTLMKIKETKEAFKYTLIFLAFFIRFNGYALNVDSCGRCNKNKDFIGLSYGCGSLICESCFDFSSDIQLSKQEIESLKILFANKYKVVDETLNEDISLYKKILVILCDFLTYYNNINIISKKMILL